MTRNIKTAPAVKARNITGKLGRGDCTREERRAKLETAIRKVLAKEGFAALTRGNVATAAECTAGMINNHFGSADDMRAWAADDAVTRKDMKVLKRMHKDGFELPKMSKAMRAECIS